MASASALQTSAFGRGEAVGAMNSLPPPRAASRAPSGHLRRARLRIRPVGPGRAPVALPRCAGCAADAVLELLGKGLEHALDGLELLFLGVHLPGVVPDEAAELRLSGPVHEDRHHHVLRVQLVGTLGCGVGVALHAGVEALQSGVLIVHDVLHLLGLLYGLVVVEPRREGHVHDARVAGTRYPAEHPLGLVALPLQEVLHLRLLRLDQRLKLLVLLFLFMVAYPGLERNVLQALLVAGNDAHHGLLRVVLLGRLEIAHFLLGCVHLGRELPLLFLILDVLDPHPKALGEKHLLVALRVPLEHLADVLDLELLVLHELLLGIINLLLELVVNRLLRVVLDFVGPPAFEDRLQERLVILRRQAHEHRLRLLVLLLAETAQPDVQLFELDSALLRLPLAPA
mmetsp:Transcript_100473/g.279829  ORF Transcript_100473/g.279829 Transcript_100473/m.279829 type:complete len:399 (+) Transcript_100473:153-1349(+)